MNKKFNPNEFLTKEQGPIWTVKVQVYSYLLEDSKIKELHNKRWKIKEILN